MTATASLQGCSSEWSSSNDAWPSSGLPDPALIRGIAAYRRHPWRRTLPDPPVLWAEGAARVLDFGAVGEPAVLFVPSLVNRATILDLMPEHSMLRWLAARGVRPLLLDWGWPGAVERGYGLGGYITGPLERALAAMPGPVVLAGYCMGGLLALAAALRRPDRVRALALLATPWDFHAEDPAAATRLAGHLPALEPVLRESGVLPVDALQVLFAGLDPGSIAGKYRSFAALDQDGPAAARFVALEDWLNDGIPLAAPVARETIGGWYGANAPARGAWHVGGAPVEPTRLAMPCFAAIPGRDRIVPSSSAEPLAGLIPGAAVVRPAAGHVGMVAGARAEAVLWAPLLEWLTGSLP